MLKSVQITNKGITVLAGVVLSIVALVIAKEWWELLLLPIGMLVVWLTLYRLDWAMWFVVAATPLSVNLTDLTGGSGLSLPTEPMMVLITGLVIIKMVFFGEFDRRLLLHPISIAIYVYLVWMLLTVITSQLPLISLKQWVTRIWFIVPYYFFLGHLFLRNPKNAIRFLWFFLVPLIIACCYTIVIHSQYGFTKKTSTWVMFPLFKEHTSYGAVLALFYPAAIYLAFRKTSWVLKAISSLLLVILTVALVLSYTRAAWLSLVGAGLVYLIYLFRMSKSVVWTLVGIVCIITALNFSMISSKFERNTTDSSDDLNEHVASVTNVSTDASNLERINRWKCAIRMFQERPLLGHGPGTYMFLYAPYQKPSEKTIISTNGGNRGNAHSEYLGPLAESGILGLATFLGLIISVVVVSIKTYQRIGEPRVKGILRLAFLGLITYYLHGFLNNFLDMDKASAPFWGFTAIIASLSIRHRLTVK
ncbi:O-antigen ligase family protein [Schleiferiaceae bacterium]|nr:O-antigen ligase family protein [Schleiferiaceae bacterium]MDA8820350.1 O-antigen ligase family protein [Schleiferiaceae bacterium]